MSCDSSTGSVTFHPSVRVNSFTFLLLETVLDLFEVVSRMMIIIGRTTITEIDV